MTDKRNNAVPAHRPFAVGKASSARDGGQAPLTSDASVPGIVFGSVALFWTAAIVLTVGFAPVRQWAAAVLLTQLAVTALLMTAASRDWTAGLRRNAVARDGSRDLKNA